MFRFRSTAVTTNLRCAQRLWRNWTPISVTGRTNCAESTCTAPGRELRLRISLSGKSGTFVHLVAGNVDYAAIYISERNDLWCAAVTQSVLLPCCSGGLSNLLYFCSLPAGRPTLQREPSRVLLRLYGQLHGERALEGLVTEAVIFTMLSESQRGPRLLGVFPGGRLEEYIPVSPQLIINLLP